MCCVCMCAKNVGLPRVLTLSNRLQLFAKFLREQAENGSLQAILKLHAPPRPANEKLRLHFSALQTTIKDFTRLAESTLALAQSMSKGRPAQGRREAILF